MDGRAALQVVDRGLEALVHHRQVLTEPAQLQRVVPLVPERHVGQGRGRVLGEDVEQEQLGGHRLFLSGEHEVAARAVRAPQAEGPRPARLRRQDPAVLTPK